MFCRWNVTSGFRSSLLYTSAFIFSTVYGFRMKENIETVGILNSNFRKPMVAFCPCLLKSVCSLSHRLRAGTFCCHDKRTQLTFSEGNLTAYDIVIYTDTYVLPPGRALECLTILHMFSDVEVHELQRTRCQNGFVYVVSENYSLNANTV